MTNKKTLIDEAINIGIYLHEINDNMVHINYELLIIEGLE